jgi:hypothetical protein
MTYREDAPRPRGDESPGQYLNRLAAYYNEPDRRRMGSESRAYLEQAVVAMDTPVEPLLTLLATVAVLPIENMTDTVLLRKAYDTVNDIADRINAVLKERKYWWVPPNV